MTDDGFYLGNPNFMSLHDVEKVNMDLRKRMQVNFRNY